MTHELKTWPEYFAEIESGAKSFEIRHNDRGFKVGDTLILNEWNPDTLEGTGRSLSVKVEYLTSFGQPKGQVVMSIAKLDAALLARIAELEKERDEKHEIASGLQRALSACESQLSAAQKERDDAVCLARNYAERFSAANKAREGAEVQFSRARTQDIAEISEATRMMEKASNEVDSLRSTVLALEVNEGRLRGRIADLQQKVIDVREATLACDPHPIHQGRIDAYDTMLEGLKHIAALSAPSPERETLPLSQVVTWIPVSERLPEEDGEYPVSGEGEDGDYTSCGFFIGAPGAEEWRYDNDREWNPNYPITHWAHPLKSASELAAKL